MANLLRRIGEKGAIGIIETVLWRIEVYFNRLRRKFQAIRLLQKADFKAKFIHEGGLEITLPHVSPANTLLGNGSTVFTSADFLKSASSEALLRHTIFYLYANGHIDRRKSIIDIGCWCGDNTLAWAKSLNRNATVYAIDPSSENLAFSQAVATANEIDNVTWVQAVCSDTVGEPLGFTGTIEHATFFVSAHADAPQIKSDTLDRIVEDVDWSSIGLMHIDVEGFEERVLRGASGIIENSLPVIAFEQHLCDENPGAVSNFLATKNYRTYMLNEVPADCRIDCRNFLAFPPNFVVPSQLLQKQTNEFFLGSVPTIPGPSLLEVHWDG